MRKAYLFIFIATFLALPTFSKAAVLPREFSKKINNFTLIYEDQKFVIDNEKLTDWLVTTSTSPTSNVSRTELETEGLIAKHFGLPVVVKNVRATNYYNSEKIYDYIAEIATGLDQQAVEPELTIEDEKAVHFTPPEDGLRTDVFATFKSALNGLNQNATSTDMAVYVTKPKKSLAETNNLGIVELIARGESKFNGSPKNRRHNIAVGMEKIKGVIVKQGEEFSFNENLGPVEADQGFLPELVIKRTGTVPELGGGLCQVSSTTFRAAMKAGLPITQRKNHSYAVQYYAPQGTDATIYPGVIDLKFVNNTPAPILIWSYLKDKDTLIFDFYGVKDSRQVVLSTPVQYDRKTDGSMKATWEREVTMNGETKKDVFKSTYLPPALFHKEENFVAAAETPPATPETGLQAPATN